MFQQLLSRELLPQLDPQTQPFKFIAAHPLLNSGCRCRQHNDRFMPHEPAEYIHAPRGSFQTLRRRLDIFHIQFRQLYYRSLRQQGR